MSLEKQVLENGLRILLLPIAGARSASVGVWIAAGSRFETPSKQGISHFVEHMLFKGTDTRSARDISEQMDRLGGNLNAYTTKEYTRYYAQTLSENAAETLELLTDMLLHSRMDADAVELERSVILDEMSMYEDVGEDVAHEQLCGALWPDSPLGRPICGSRESVAAITAADLRQYVQQNYTPERMLVVLAGGFDRSALLDVVHSTLGTLPRGTGRPAGDKPAFTPSLTLCTKDFEQVSLELAFPGIPSGDDRRYALLLFNFIVGGGASSRLFQRLREELGLAYSIYSANYAAEGAGVFTIAAATAPEQQETVLREIYAVLDGLRGGVTEEEFLRARAQVKASHIMGLETIAAQASYVGRNELLLGRNVSSDEVLEALDALTLDDVNRLAADLLGGRQAALSVVGAVRDRAFYAPYWNAPRP